MRLKVRFMEDRTKLWSQSLAAVPELDQPGHQVRPDEHQPPDGNYAAVIATAEAHGADSSVTAAQTTALTVENQFSFVTAIAGVAV
jgi:hypothetical protein